jgi:hypothetical protein
MPGEKPAVTAECTRCGLKALVNPRPGGAPARCPQCHCALLKSSMQPPVQVTDPPAKNTDPKYDWVDHYGKCAPILYQDEDTCYKVCLVGSKR